MPERGDEVDDAAWTPWTATAVTGAATTAAASERGLEEAWASWTATAVHGALNTAAASERGSEEARVP